MEIRELDMETLDGNLRAAILEMERDRRLTKANLSGYWASFRRGRNYGFFHGQELVGLVSIWPDCSYFGGSVLIQKLMYRWDYNTPDFIADMVTQIAAMHRSSLLCLDIHGTRDWNLGLYKEMGFEKSVMRSPMSAENVVLVCTGEKILAAGEKRKNA